MSFSTAVPSVVQVLRELGPGLRVGEVLTVPDAAIGVTVSRAGVVMDRLPPGEIEISPANLPNTFQHLRVNPAPGTVADVAVFAVYPAGSRTIQWSCDFFVSNDSHPGVNTAHASGLAQIRIVEPGAFIGGLLAYCHAASQQGQDHQSFKLSTGSGKNWAPTAIASLPQQAELIVAASIGQQVAAAALEAMATPTEGGSATLKVQYQAQAPVEAWLHQSGMKLEGFSVEDLSSPDRAPCCSCGSTVAPTALVTFHRNISLFYVRYHTTHPGNFCLPCGVKSALINNMIMLVCGWWGIIGAIVTPFLIIGNTYSLIKLGIGPRRAASDLSAPVSGAQYLGPSA